MKCRIVALDIDGTILDPFGKLTGAVREAVAAARQRGLWVVLCTGRRFRTALPCARELSLDGAIVVNNGVLVKDIASGDTLDHRYLPVEDCSEAIAFVRRVCPPLVYVDTYHEDIDLVTESLDEAHSYQREYLNDNTAFFHSVDDLREHPRSDVIMVSTMADEETAVALRDEAREKFGERFDIHILINKNYHGVILEFMSPRAGKWSALATLAAQAKVSPEQIIAVGDDTNDIEMIRCAGLGIAMGNSAPEVQNSADVVVRSNAEGGVVEAIERALLLS